MPIKPINQLNGTIDDDANVFPVESVNFPNNRVRGKTPTLASRPNSNLNETINRPRAVQSTG